MRALRRGMIAVAAALAACLLGGCGPHVEGLYRVPGFGPLPLLHGGVVVAGVGAAPYDLHPAEADQLAEELRLALASELPPLAAVPAGAVAQAMGIADHDGMLANLSRTGRAAPAEVAALARLLPDQRFAVFARVEQDRVGQARHRGETPVYEETKDKKKRLVHYQLTETLSTSREVLAQVTVVELATGQVAWSGRTRAAAANENRLQDLRRPGDAVLNVNLGGPADYPPPPDLAPLAGRAFREAARSMVDTP